PPESVEPVHHIVGKGGPVGRQLPLEQPLEHAPSYLSGRRRLVPVLDTGGKLPLQEAVLAATLAVAVIPNAVHGNRAGRARHGAANDSAERRGRTTSHSGHASGSSPSKYDVTGAAGISVHGSVAGRFRRPQSW